MQAASDLFLGWTHDETSGVDYYWRNLRDMKASADVNAQPTNTFMAYGELCGATLARAHARSGDAAAISGYLGKGNAFGRALGRFAISYADQNARDHAALVQAIKDGKLPAESNV
jgi:thiamine monophosphate kinase